MLSDLALMKNKAPCKRHGKLFDPDPCNWVKSKVFNLNNDYMAQLAINLLFSCRFIHPSYQNNQILSRLNLVNAQRHLVNTYLMQEVLL